MFGKNILFAYDIGCSFSQTLSKSLIADMVHDTNFKTCTRSFHDTAHNRSCQLEFIIGLQEGAGTSDAEDNKHLYSKSNALALVTHHTSSYNQHGQIHTHFIKWDEMKYEHLGMFKHYPRVIIHFLPYETGEFLIGSYTSVWRIIKESAGVLETTRQLFPTFNPDTDCP